MSTISSALGKPWTWFIGSAAALAAMCLLLAGIREIWISRVCDTEVLDKRSGILGFDFEISETGCSPLAHDLAVSVLISKAGRRKGTPLFKYAPVYVGPYPTIDVIDEHTVVVSVSRVSSIFCQTDKWNGLSIRYNIGGVDYPGDPARLRACN
jgi:hypothetical protein